MSLDWNQRAVREREGFFTMSFFGGRVSKVLELIHGSFGVEHWIREVFSICQLVFGEFEVCLLYYRANIHFSFFHLQKFEDLSLNQFVVFR